jgi:hypothetical protein
VEITGTIKNPNGEQTRVTASGNTYEEATAALEAIVPEGQKLIVIPALSLGSHSMIHSGSQVRQMSEGRRRLGDRASFSSALPTAGLPPTLS